MLLKPRVFLHLLFNRGSPPRKAGEPAKLEELRPKPVEPTPAVEGDTGRTGEQEVEVEAAEAAAVAEQAEDRPEEDGPAEGRQGDGEGAERVVAGPAEPAPRRHFVEPRQETVHAYLVRLFTITLLAEVAVRLASAPLVSFPLLIATALRVGLELGAQLATSTALALVLLRWRGWYTPSTWGVYEPSVPSNDGGYDEAKQAGQKGQKDGRQRGFLPALIPLVLLYMTLLPLLLQLGLSVWSVAASPLTGLPGLPGPQTSTPLSESFAAVAPWLVSRVPPQMAREVDRAWASSNKLWLGTRLLGGMSAGFGLRVLLPTPPLVTTAVVLAGWGAALGVGSWLDPWL